MKYQRNNLTKKPNKITEWVELFRYIKANYDRLKAEGSLSKLIHRLNSLAGNERR